MCSGASTTTTSVRPTFAFRVISMCGWVFLRILAIEKDHDQYRDDARELMRIIQEKCVEYDAERKLSIIVECIAGKVTQTIDRLIALYRPESLVVGTRGQRSMMQAWAGAFGAPGVGSVSK